LSGLCQLRTSIIPHLSSWLKVRSHRMQCVALRCVTCVALRRLAVCGKNDATCRTMSHCNAPDPVRTELFSHVTVSL